MFLFFRHVVYYLAWINPMACVFVDVVGRRGREDGVWVAVGVGRSGRVSRFLVQDL